MPTDPRTIRSTRLALLLCLAATLLSACFPGLPGGATATPKLPVSSNVNGLPGAKDTAARFLAAWQKDDYPAMYAELTQVSQDALPEDQFEKKYRETAAALSLQKLDYEILSTLTGAQTAQVSFRATYHTALLGDVPREIVMTLSIEKQGWKVQWEDGLILPELKGGNTLMVDYQVPARGDIYDRTGKAMAATADAISLGVEPGKLNPDQEQDMLVLLSQLTGLPPETIQAMYKESRAAYIPIGEAPAAVVRNQYNELSAISGLVMKSYRSRYYFDGGVAPQVTGYVLSISPEQLETYRRNGYSGDEKVGAAGLEEWGEQELAGKRGASLYVLAPDNRVVTRLAETQSQPAHYIYTTLDKDLQLQAQKSMEGFKGAIVVLERDTGRVLAMVSNPGYDPNWFDPNNENNGSLASILNDEGTPLLNRATQGNYPLGSVAKIITMAAALESGEMNTTQTYNCGYEFTELGGGQTLYDWTYTFGVMPSGTVTLPEGLMVSCNPLFWHLGLSMYQDGRKDAVAKMARAFGLGSKTGIEGIPESAGSYPDPQNEGDAVQMAIGQGPMLVTPLQVADFIAAVGNGGTLYQPQLVEKIATADGDPISSFKPIVKGKLPVKPEDLAVIQDAMRAVVEDQRGTARNSFTGLQIPVFGKTGTAQNAGDEPHAWFAGYTDAGRSDRPDIAAVVIAENAGEGSVVAAPIFRRIVEIYFSGKPTILYPWESSFFVLPTKVPTETPVPPDTATPEPSVTLPPTLPPYESPTPSKTPASTKTPTRTPMPTATKQ